MSIKPVVPQVSARGAVQVSYMFLTGNCVYFVRKRVVGIHARVCIATNTQSQRVCIDRTAVYDHILSKYIKQNVMIWYMRDFDFIAIQST